MKNNLKPIDRFWQRKSLHGFDRFFRRSKMVASDSKNSIEEISNWFHCRFQTNFLHLVRFYVVFRTFLRPFPTDRQLKNQTESTR